MITNLVHNAIRFTAGHGRVSISARRQGQEVVIEVTDTGIGIPKQDLPKIFDRFYRVHRPGRQIQGTGLGLAIVKEIVNMHTGRIEVESEPDKGTTFTVFLPLDMQPQTDSSSTKVPITSVFADF
jgi:two-component system phosphate regulon sensor histidine kinase PhoR